jgi:hypothetical protein
MQNKLSRRTSLSATDDAPPEHVDPPLLMERLRAVAVEFDDLFAGQPYKPKRPPRLRSKARSRPNGPPS